MRTSKEAVALVMEPANDYNGTTDLQPFMEAATAMVDIVASKASTYNRTALTTTQAELVERWLAAHFYKCSDRQLQTSNAGRSNASFSQLGEGLKSTTYGATACILDTSRILLPLSEGRIAGTVWLGKVPSDQIPYSQRN